MAPDPSSAVSASLTDAGSSEQQGPLEIIRALLDAWRGMAEARLSLIWLDLAVAAVSVGRMIAIAIVVAVTALFTWLIAVALAIVWAMEHGFNGYFLTLCVIGVHLTAVFVGMAFINHLRRSLGAQLVRHLSRNVP